MKKRIIKIQLVNYDCMHFYSKHLVTIDSKTNKFIHSNINTSGIYPSFKSSYKIDHKKIKTAFEIIQPLVEKWDDKYLVPGFCLDGATQDFIFFYNDKTQRKVQITFNYGPSSYNDVLNQLWSLRDEKKEEDCMRYIKNPQTPLSKLKKPILPSPVEKRLKKTISKKIK